MHNAKYGRVRGKSAIQSIFADGGSRTYYRTRAPLIIHLTPVCSFFSGRALMTSKGSYCNAAALRLISSTSDHVLPFFSAAAAAEGVQTDSKGTPQDWSESVGSVQVVNAGRRHSAVDRGYVCNRSPTFQCLANGIAVAWRRPAAGRDRDDILVRLSRLPAGR